jgi:hypothetical protein
MVVKPLWKVGMRLFMRVRGDVLTFKGQGHPKKVSEIMLVLSYFKVSFLWVTADFQKHI